MNKFSIDIANPEKRIAIECHGDYWHANPKFYAKRNQTQGRNVGRDRIKKILLEKDGWKVIELWECDIKNNLEKCIDEIKWAINDSLENPWDFIEIKSIEYVGEEETYDLEINHPEHNYIAEMFVVHNSHAAEYSVISYWCAWLKTYYPLYFYAALLRHEQDKAMIFRYSKAAQEAGVEIEMPHINKSAEGYAARDGKIYAGFDSIVGIGSRSAQKIIKLQPYESYEDFIKKVKPTQKLMKGLVISDCFRDWKINKRVCFEHDPKTKYNAYDALEKDFDDAEHTKLLYEYTTLKPKTNIVAAFDFGPRDYMDIVNLTEEFGSRQVLLRGMITEVINKDKLLRGDLKKHTHKFGQHMIYLNLNDGSGDIACQVGPHTYELYSDIINDLERKPIIILGTLNKDAKKCYVDLLQPLGAVRGHIDRFEELIQKSGKGTAVLSSATPQVSKNGKSYYRVRLHNGKDGLCFRFEKKLQPGMMVQWQQTKEPFMDIRVLEVKV